MILHTLIDAKRTDGEREINHHGKTIKIGDDGKPIHDNDTQVEDVLVHLKKTAYMNHAAAGATTTG